MIKLILIKGLNIIIINVNIFVHFHENDLEYNTETTTD